jgi:hypothetical protein
MAAAALEFGLNRCNGCGGEKQARRICSEKAQTAWQERGIYSARPSFGKKLAE